MLFSEVYSAYFLCLEAIVCAAQKGELNAEELSRIVREKAFTDSGLEITDAIRSQSWLLVDKNYETPLQRVPSRPLSTLEKRWLKTLLSDARIGCFDVDDKGLEDIEPLCEPSDVVYFDRYADGDDFEDKGYKARFRVICDAIHRQVKIRVCYRNPSGRMRQLTVSPKKLEYSAKDDKFRLIASDNTTLNLGRIESALALDAPAEAEPESKREARVDFELIDERNALHRAMLAFSDCRKITRRLEGNRYSVQLYYAAEDQTEILIRILSFGPLLQVTGPKPFVRLVRERIQKQLSMGS